MAKDVLKGLDPEVKDVLQDAMNRCVAAGRVTQKQIRESGITGRKYPYDQVAQAINSLQETEITEENINRIIREGWIWSGRVAGPKKLSSMIKYPKAKEIILS